MDMKVSDEFIAPGPPTDRFAYAFRVAVARPPRPAEAAILKRLFEAELDAIQEPQPHDSDSKNS